MIQVREEYEDVKEPKVIFTEGRCHHGKKFYARKAAEVRVKLFLFALAGAVFAALGVNLIGRAHLPGAGLFPELIKEQLKQPVKITGTIVMAVIMKRIRVYIFMLAAGASSLRKQAVLGMAVWTGILTGAAVSMTLLENGITGFILMTCVNLPHSIFYMVSMVMLMTEIYIQRKEWKVYGSCFLWWAAGLISEIWINPLIVKGIFYLMS